MITIAFDTLKFANTLKEAGVPPAQAEAEAMALAEVLEVNLKDLGTKDDLRYEMRDLEQRLFIKLGALMAVSIGIATALDNSTLSDLPKAVMPAGKRASSTMDGELKSIRGDSATAPALLYLPASVQSWIPAIHAGMTMYFL